VIPADVRGGHHAQLRRHRQRQGAAKLIQKLLFATASVVALVFLALGRREAAIVGTAVMLTLTVTLFASWAWGFTLNRVSLFALIFSIGILVDDAIVVVENIHRHQQLHPDKQAGRDDPRRVDEVGGPTILATLTVIAALLPMAFRQRADGPVHEPDPDQREHGHAAVAGHCLRGHALAGAPVDEGRMPAHAHPGDASRRSRPGGRRTMAARLEPAVRAGSCSARCCNDERAAAQPLPAGAGRGADRRVGGAAGAGLVQLKMLPFDNKSEFQVVVDMPAGTPLEQTAAVLRELGATSPPCRR
jgi:hypothetical protein